MMTRIRIFWGLPAAALIAAVGPGLASPASPAQPACNGSFSTVSDKDVAVRAAYDVRNLGQAIQLVGKPACFKGHVVRVYLTSSRNFASLDFDKDYKKAIVAVAIGDAVSRMPGIESLAGQELVISGTVSLYKGQPEIKLKSPTQIKRVAASAGKAI